MGYIKSLAPVAYWCCILRNKHFKYARTPLSLSLALCFYLFLSLRVTTVLISNLLLYCVCTFIWWLSIKKIHRVLHVLSCMFILAVNKNTLSYINSKKYLFSVFCYLCLMMVVHVSMSCFKKWALCIHSSMFELIITFILVFLYCK